MTKQIKATFTIKISGSQGKYIILAEGPNRIEVKHHSFNWIPTVEQKDTISNLQTKPRLVSHEKLVDLGKGMYQAIFTPAIAIAFGRVQQALRGEEGARIRMVIEPKELSHLPWELMHDGHGFISLRSNYPLVRGINETILTRRTTVRGPLRILYVWAEPKDLPSLNLEAPAEKIREIIAENKRIKFDILPHATFNDLSSALLKDYHILCFAGHGTENYIYLEKGDGSVPVSASTLASELEGKSTRVVFLAACKTGSIPSEELAGFANSLAARVEVPAVIAMQYEVYDEEANQLTARFFKTLAAFRPVDASISEARKAIVDEDKTVRDVFAPVLYLQTTSGDLFVRDRNRIAIGAIILALIAFVAFAMQTLYFQPDRQQIAFAQRTAQAEATAHTDAIKTAQTESYIRQTAQANEQLRQQEAKQQSDIAIARHLADLSVKSKDNQLAILLAVESLRRGTTTEGYQAAISSITSSSQMVASVQYDLANPIMSLLPDFPPHSPAIYPTIVDMLHYDADDNWVTKPSIARVENSNQLLVTVYRWRPDYWQEFYKTKRTISTIDSTSSNFRVLDTVRFSYTGKWCAYFDGESVILWNVINDQNALESSLPGVIAIRFSEDATRLMAATSHGQIRIWDTSSGKELSNLQIIGTIHSAELSPDSSSIAVSIENEETLTMNLSIYQIGISDPILELNGAQLAGFSQDGQYVAILPYIGEIDIPNYQRFDVDLYRLGNDQPVASLTDNRFISFNPIANQLLTMSHDQKTLYLTDTVNRQTVARFAHPDSCTSLSGLSFSHNGQILATSCSTGVIYIWGANSGQIINTIHLSYAPDSLIFSANDKMLATANLDALPVNVVHSTQVNIWGVESGKSIGQIIQGELVEEEGIPSNLATSILFDPMGSWLATTDTQNTFRVLNIANSWSDKVAEYVHDDPGLQGSIKSAWSYALSSFSPTDPIIAIGGGNGKTEIWDFLKNKILFSIPPASAEVAKEMVFSPDGNWLAISGVFCQGGAGCSNKSVRIIDVHTGKVLRIDTQYLKQGSGSYMLEAHIKFSPNSHFLAIGWEDGLLSLYETGNWIKATTSRNLASNIQHIAFSSDHKEVAVGFKDGKISVFLAKQGLPEKAHFNETELTSLAISPDGSIIATGSSGGRITIKDLKNNNVISSLNLTSSIGFIAFNQDGNYIAATDDNTLAIWSSYDDKSVLIVQKPERFGQYSYSTDGRLAITGITNQYLVLETTGSKEFMRFPGGYLPALSSDNHYYTGQTDITGTIAVWRWQPVDLIGTACERVSRNLTEEEWNNYFGNEPYRTTCPNLP